MTPDELNRLRTAGKHFFKKNLERIKEIGFINKLNTIKDLSDCLDGYFLQYAENVRTLWQNMEKKSEEFADVADENVMPFLTDVLLSSIETMSFVLKIADGFVALRSVLFSLGRSRQRESHQAFRDWSFC